MDYLFGVMVRFIANKYIIWKPRIKDLLNCQDYYDFTEHEGKNPNPTKDCKVEDDEQ